MVWWVGLFWELGPMLGSHLNWPSILGIHLLSRQLCGNCILQGSPCSLHHSKAMNHLGCEECCWGLKYQVWVKLI